MRFRPLAAILVGISVPACSTSGPQDNLQEAAAVDDHFSCAAMIGAADRLVVTGRVAPNETIRRDGLFAAMGHINIWAIPKKLPEKQAFDEVNRERDRLLSSVPSNEILARALACVEQAKVGNGR